jgi:hypothetical protein
MRRGALGAVVASSLVLLLAPGAGASHDPSGAPFDEDFAVGRGGFEVGQAVLDAHSGALGENPRGRATFGERLFLIGGRVTCLRVSGNRATIGG